MTAEGSLGPREGLVGFWKLNETGGDVATDYSGHGNHGRRLGATWGEVGGRSAAHFDGTGASIEVPHTAALAIERDITIAAWIWKEVANRGERWDAILSKTPGIWDYELLTSKARSDEPAFFSPLCDPTEVYGGLAVPAGEWAHVAVTRRGTEVVFFFNGRPTGTAVMTGAFLKSGGALQMGHDGAPGNGGMIGSLADVALYDRGLDEGEIVHLFDATRNHDPAPTK